MSDTYTRVVGAKVLHETTAAYKFELGDETHWVPKSQSKLENGQLYILRWVYNQRNAQLSKSTVSQNAAERLTVLLREALAILRDLH